MRSSKKIVNKKARNPLDILIFEKGLRIKDVVVYKDLDLIVLILNNGSVFDFKISDYPILKTASEKELNNWGMIGDGIGLHWEKLDEDLSLKGFIQTAALNEAINLLKPKRG